MDDLSFGTGDTRVQSARSDEAEVTRELAAAEAWWLSFSNRQGDEVAPILRRAVMEPDEESLRAKEVAFPLTLSWNDLAALDRHTAGAGHSKWAEACEAAQAELDNGHRAARVVEVASELAARARFIALRGAFYEEWQPRGGIEVSIVDAAAQAYSQYEEWLSICAVRGGAMAARQGKQMTESGQWALPLQEAAAALEQAAAMAERFHRMYLRTLRTLREHRRHIGAAVVVQNAGQINLASEQINVSR